MARYNFEQRTSPNEIPRFDCSIFSSTTEVPLPLSKTCDGRHPVALVMASDLAHLSRSRSLRRVEFAKHLARRDVPFEALSDIQ